jgi:hypothetical protein
MTKELVHNVLPPPPNTLYVTPSNTAGFSARNIGDRQKD